MSKYWNVHVEVVSGNGGLTRFRGIANGTHEDSEAAIASVIRDFQLRGELSGARAHPIDYTPSYNPYVERKEDPGERN
jgi:hypothetical protein